MRHADHFADATTAERGRRRGRAAMASLAIVASALGIHTAGRVAAFGSPHVVDSMTYAVAAYRLWQADPAPAVLVSDKPPGQAILTGWAFPAWPAEASRATLAPIETAFMLAAYAIFAAIALRVGGGAAAAVATLGLVIAVNSYNAFDSTTDGFNLAENYVSLPILLAVFGHVCVRSVGVGGVLTGAGLGLALAVKQTALAVTAAILLHSLYELLSGKAVRSRAVRLEWTLLGVGLSWLPIAAFMQAQGLLGRQIRDLFEHSAAHVAVRAPELPGAALVAPLFPLLLWMVIGGAARVTLGQRSDPSDVNRTGRSTVVFAAVWFTCELAMASLMTKPAEHYAQLVVPPAALLAAMGVSATARALASLNFHARKHAVVCLAAMTAGLFVSTTAPIISLARRNAPTIDLEREHARFEIALQRAEAVE